MTKLFLLIISSLLLQFGFTQYQYDVNIDYPYGQANPKAPQEIKDYQMLIGKSKCYSLSRINQSTWSDTTDMFWTFKYIMNGMAVQDETLKADGKHSGSIRQFNSDSSLWYVHYYSTSSIPNRLPTWKSQSEANKIVLYRDQKSPDGTEGYYRLSFYDISENSFNWIGEWTSKDESRTYATWKISCEKIK